MVIIIMGISGSGKTSVGKELSTVTGLPFFDADDYHPAANIHKMKNNIPLNDEDRQPWLETLSLKIKEWELSGGAILACSALKESYRQILSASGANIFWVFLNGSLALIRTRMEARGNHYMQPALLQSQFDALEVPHYGLHINIEAGMKDMLDQIISGIKSNA